MTNLLQLVFWHPAGMHLDFAGGPVVVRPLGPRTATVWQPPRLPAAEFQSTTLAPPTITRVAQPGPELLSCV